MLEWTPSWLPSHPLERYAEPSGTPTSPSSMLPAMYPSSDHQESLPFTLTRCGGMFGVHMAEYVVGQIIGRERDFLGMKRDQLNKKWWEEATRKDHTHPSHLIFAASGTGLSTSNIDC